MKPKLLLFSLFTFIILNISFAQSREPVPVQSLISDDKFDTIHIYYLNTSHLIAYYPNKVFIKSKTDKI